MEANNQTKERYNLATFKEVMIEELQKNGMFENHAQQVMELAITDMDYAHGRWNDEASEYPSGVAVSLWYGVRRVACGWIKENLPQAWYRPMFDDEMAEQIRPEYEEWLQKEGASN